MSYLDSSGLGYKIPTGDAGQVKTLPWANINQVVIQFTDDVDVTEGDLVIRGVAVSTYSFVDFSYNGGTYTATWTLSGYITADKLLIDLDGDSDPVRSVVGGVALDGEWTNSASSYPSGDGVAGGDFEFRFNVLPGDFNQNGSVTIVDVTNVRSRQYTGIGIADYSIFADMNGSGTITITDVTTARNNQYTALPIGEPSGFPVPTDLEGSAESQELEATIVNGVGSVLTVETTVNLLTSTVETIVSTGSEIQVENEESSANLIQTAVAVETSWQLSASTAEGASSLTGVNDSVVAGVLAADFQSYGSQGANLDADLCDNLFGTLIKNEGQSDDDFGYGVRDAMEETPLNDAVRARLVTKAPAGKRASSHSLWDTALLELTPGTRKPKRPSEEVGCLAWNGENDEDLSPSD